MNAVLASLEECHKKVSNIIIVEEHSNHNTTKRFNGRGSAIPNVIMNVVGEQEKATIYKKGNDKKIEQKVADVGEKRR